MRDIKTITMFSFDIRRIWEQIGVRSTLMFDIPDQSSKLFTIYDAGKLLYFSGCVADYKITLSD